LAFTTAERVLQARLPAVAWKQCLGSDYVESDVVCHQGEIRVKVDQLQPMICAERADENVNRLSVNAGALQRMPEG